MSGIKNMMLLVPERKTVAAEGIVPSSFNYSLQLFDERSLAFFQQVSAELLSNVQFRQNPEIVSLSFWLRKASLEEIRKQNLHLTAQPAVRTVPVGLVFHVCPGNVDTMFVYSICISLLAGNRNVIRISSDINPETDYLIDSLNRVLQKSEHALMRDYIAIVNYPHDDEINSYFSQMADARVLWGGDKTVQTFKKFQTKPRCKDVVFPNRISYSLVNMDTFVAMNEKQKNDWIRNFYNDTYIFNQKGCSSPQMLFLLNSDAEKEKQFYSALTAQVKKQYQADVASLASLKYNSLVGDIVTGKADAAIAESNLVYFVQLHPGALLPDNCGGGYFYYLRIGQVADILPYMDSSSQTLTYLGLDAEALEQLNTLLAGKGVDRIVQAGSALKFNNYWDGYNLLDELTRKRYIEF